MGISRIARHSFRALAMFLGAVLVLSGPLFAYFDPTPLPEAAIGCLTYIALGTAFIRYAIVGNTRPSVLLCWLLFGLGAFIILLGLGSTILGGGWSKFVSVSPWLLVGASMCVYSANWLNQTSSAGAN